MFETMTKRDDTTVHVRQCHNADNMLTSNTLQTLCIVVSTRNSKQNTDSSPTGIRYTPASGTHQHQVYTPVSGARL